MAKTFEYWVKQAKKLHTGDLLWCYDDGKLTPSRQYTVEVQRVINYEDADEDLKKHYKIYCKDNEDLGIFKNHPIGWKTPFFIITKSDELPDCYKEEVFALDDESVGWFGIGLYFKEEEVVDVYWSSGLLDIDGSLTQKMEDDYKALKTLQDGTAS